MAHGINKRANQPYAKKPMPSGSLSTTRLGGGGGGGDEGSGRGACTYEELEEGSLARAGG